VRWLTFRPFFITASSVFAQERSARPEPETLLVARFSGVSVAAKLRAVARSFKRDLAVDLAIDPYMVRIVQGVSSRDPASASANTFSLANMA